LDAFATFLHGCAALRNKVEWQKACADAADTARDDASLRRFFEADFTPYAIVNPDASTEGTITGYYEPLLRGSRKQIVLEGDVPSPANPPSGCRFHPRCPDAIDKCRVAAPPLETARDGRRVRCWRADEPGLLSAVAS
jgi:oligopeptide/dipeptide ABC transporter ATP-binding protein